MAKVIKVRSDVTGALRKIREARGPIRVALLSESCQGGVIYDLMALSNSMASCFHTVTAVVYGTVSLIALVGADEIEIKEGGAVYIGSITMVSTGNATELKAAAELLSKMRVEISKELSKWPKIQALFDADSPETHFLTSEEFKRLTEEGGQHE